MARPVPRRPVYVVECPCGGSSGTPPYSCLRCRVVVTRGSGYMVGRPFGSKWAGYGALTMTVRRQANDHLASRRTPP
jgi:hypothetical protein